MRRSTLVLFVALLASGCIASVGDGSDGSSPSPLKWEYKQDVVCVGEHMPGGEHQSQIDSLLRQRGMEGWELVSVNPSSTAQETCYLLIFKRRTM